MAEFTDYHLGQKNNWRRRCWNDIARRLTPNQRRDGLVLYLSAENDLDRRVAVSKGFNPNNMIAVDNDQGIVEALTAKKKVAICGDYCELLANWRKPLSVVHADFCGTIKQFFPMLDALLLSEAITPETVILINVLKGRERNLAPLIESAKSHTKDGVPAEIVDNRGRWILQFVFQAMCEMHGVRMSDVDMPRYMEQIDPFVTEYESHRKKGLYFNTIIFNARQLSCKFDREYGIEIGRIKPKVARKVAAVCAVQTMRKNGRLPSAPAW